MSNRFQSTRNPSHPSNARQPTNSSPYGYERLRHFPRLPGRPGDTEGSDSLLPPSKPLFRQNVAPEKECGTSKGMIGPSTSMSSDEDLRAIEVQLQELLEPDSPEPGRKTGARSESQMTLPLSSGKIISFVTRKYYLIY